MKHAPATILFFGRPGAGKSTQAESIAEYFRKNGTRRVLPFMWSYVRDEFMRGNSGVQKRLQENHAAGKLQPKFFSVSVWGPVLLQQLTGDEHLIIDGLPRQQMEADALDSAFEFFDRDTVLIFNMLIPADRAADRMRGRAKSESRTDDANEESITRRLEWFETDTAPILDLFRQEPRYVIVDIDADRTREEVQKDLQEVIVRLYGNLSDEPSKQEVLPTDGIAIVSIGMPGAGKTTILKPLADRHGLAYVSRDDIRQELFGNPILQKDKDRVWKEADRRTQSALATGTSLAYDATFAEQQKRRDFVKSLRDMGWKRIIGFYVDTPSEVARERNQNREHVVSDDEMQKFFIEPLEEHPPSLEDGFDELYTLKNLEALESLLGQE